MIIMKNYLLDDLTDRLLYKSGNNVVDDFINKNLEGEIMEFVPYNQFKDIKFIAKVESYGATWINGNIFYWDKEEINFKRNGPMRVVLKKLNNCENITSKDINEVSIH